MVQLQWNGGKYMNGVVNGLQTIWQSTEDGESASWEKWSKYFTDNFSDIRDMDIAYRFNNPVHAGEYPSRVGIVFSTSQTGKNMPVGLLVSPQGGEGYFVYHEDYVKSDGMALSGRVPKSTNRIPLYMKPGLEKGSNANAFITNRGAEGWNSHLQAVSLDQISEQYMDELVDPRSEQSRMISQPPLQLKRLLTFGRDIPGAFWVMDIDRDPEVEKAHNIAIRRAATAGRNTLAGAQPKMPGVQRGDRYFPTRFNDKTRTLQISTHIFKIGSAENKNQDVIIGEYLAMEATKKLLPHDKVADGEIVNVELEHDKKVPALALKRFDRTPGNGRRHFTEMTELLGISSDQKFDGSYWHMTKVVNPTGQIDGPEYAQARLMYERVVSGFLVGNFDNHLKNFALFNDTKTLTPNYDIESVELFGFKQSGQGIKARRRSDQEINSKMMVELGVEMGITFTDMRNIFAKLNEQIPLALEAIHDAKIDEAIISKEKVDLIRSKLEKNVSQRWQRYKDIDQIICKMEDTYRMRAERGTDIPQPFQAALYRQFAPQNLARLKPISSDEPGELGTADVISSAARS